MRRHSIVEAGWYSLGSAVGASWSWVVGHNLLPDIFDAAGAADAGDNADAGDADADDAVGGYAETAVAAAAALAPCRARVDGAVS